MEYQPIKEPVSLGWPYGRDRQVTFVASVILFDVVALIVKLRVNDVAVSAFIFSAVLYLLLLLNELTYLTKIYRMDIAQLEWEGKNNVGMMRAQAARAGGLGRSSTWDSAINKARMDGENIITRRILKYRRDYLRSIILPISSLLKK